MTKFGAQLYTVREKMQTAEGMLETLKKIKDIGYQYVQISGQGPEITAEQIADALKQTGLTCAVTHDREFGFDQMLSHVDEIARRHDMWGCQYVALGMMPPPYLESLATVRAFIQKANDISDALKKRGKIFMYHNHHFEFRVLENGKRIIDVLFEEFSPDIQFELDLYWVQKAGADPVAWVERAKGRMDICHIKDMAVRQGERFFQMEDYMAPIGSGNMNWDGIIRAMNDTGVKLTMVEIDQCPKEIMECLKDSYDFLIKKMPAK